MSTETRRFPITVKEWQSVPTEDGKGWRRVEGPDTHHEVSVTIDWEALANALGPRACRNQGGVSKEAGGMIEVRRIK